MSEKENTVTKPNSGSEFARNASKAKREATKLKRQKLEQQVSKNSNKQTYTL